MSKIRAQYDEYSGQVLLDGDQIEGLYNANPQSIIDLVTRDVDYLSLDADLDEIE